MANSAQSRVKKSKDFGAFWLGKIGRNSAFSKMIKAQQTAIRRLFEKKMLKSIAQVFLLLWWLAKSKNGL